MILYFADRKMNIIDVASTELPEGFRISYDMKTEDVDTGSVVFECKIPYDSKTMEKAEACAEAGNYILLSQNGKNEFFTIIDSEKDTKNSLYYIYAEDAGLDLLNEVKGAYTADKAYNIAYYINMFAYDSGFVIGTNEISNLTRKLSWDGESTVSARLASVATQFDNAEISYSFSIKGLAITNKYINIHKKRGADNGVQLRLNMEVDRIVTKKSVANLATAFICKGRTPENSDNPITLNGYKYDDGDFYVNGEYLMSRNALKKWSRYVWKGEPNKVENVGHIVKLYEYDTLSQSTLCAHALTELKKVCDTEVNYEIDINRLPDNVRIGDRVNIIDDDGGLYLSTRILQLQTSETENSYSATLGEHLIKGSGISQKVVELAEKFAKTSQSAAHALMVANLANDAAGEAQEQANSALAGANNAQATADEAKIAADEAKESANNAQTAANNAQSAVDIVEENVAGLETSVANAQAAADQAQQAAETADAKAVEAQTAAVNAKTQAETAQSAAVTAQNTADTAVSKADTAQSTADIAKSQAEDAATTAAAAKTDAANAQKDIDALGENLTTLSNTMTADYARKTDLTEATASLQTQITQNAAEISSTATKVQQIDETANNAAEQAAQAQNTASEAQSQASQAALDAAAAQTAADEAAAAASTAQSEADKAKAAAETAQSVADKAETDLAAAKADLATVQGRVDATEEDIAAAQEAVNTAQAAADKAKADAAEAATKAATAQTTADTAVTNAANAQTAANDAASKAALAQKTADEAKGDASAAQAAADQAASAAAEAQRTADTAKTNAATAQSTANKAASDAAAAQTAADEADAKAQQAAADLATAQQNLADVTSRVGATEEEVAAAQAAVTAAQSAADKAKAEAAAAQSTADTAKANAATAQAAADTAKNAADAAQADADAAQEAADKAQADVDALAVRVTTAETSITQNAEQIALRATKTEVAETLGGYYTKEQTDSAIVQKANEITSTVSSTYATKTALSATDTKAANAATAAANAQSSADAAQADVDAVETRLTTAESKIEQTDDSIKLLATKKEVTEVSQIAQNAQDDIDNLEIGGRNLLLRSKGDFVLEAKNTGDESDNYLYYRFYADMLLNETYTISTDVDITSGTFTEISVYPYPGGSHTPVTIPENGRISHTFTKRSDETDSVLLYAGVSGSTRGQGVIFRNVKIEKGNRATDWTPAPEDTDQKINDTSNELHQTIVEQTAQAITTSEGILMSALESYVETGNYNSFKESVESQLSVLADQIQLVFTNTTSAIESVNDDLQEKFNQITTYFAFDINGLTIGKVDNPYKMVLSNERYSMQVNGVEVLWIDAVTKEAYIPALTITDKLILLGYLFSLDSAGNLNCEYIGGE